MINVIIDEKRLEVPEETTILKAAEAAGIEIPTLCAHPELKPYGGCRLCLVEIEGMRVLQPSCTMPISEGMVISTQNEKVKAARQFILTLIFSERNHYCPYCQESGGDCELQNAALDEGMAYWPLQPNFHPYEVDASHPFIIREQNRCILCRRCVRACEELAGNATLGIKSRGTLGLLIADLGQPLGDSNCVSCGTCLQVCPTGALMDRHSAYLGLDTQSEKTESICLACSVGCGIKAVTRNNSLIRIEGNWAAPVNSGILCKAGRFEAIETRQKRLTSPLIRKNGAQVEATWDEAIETVAGKIKPLAEKSPAKVAALVSSRLPAETLALFKYIFADQMSSSMVTCAEEGKPSALPADLSVELGRSFEGSLEAINNSDCLIVIGADLGTDHMVAGFKVKRKVLEGAPLVVIDPQENSFDDLAGCVLKATGGTDVDILRALSSALVQEGLIERETTLQCRTALEKCAAVTGISAETYLTAARLIGAASNPVILYGKGITGSEDMNILKGLVTFAESIGAIGETWSGLVSVKGKANSLAAAQFGLTSAFETTGSEVIFLSLGDDVSSNRLHKRLNKEAFKIIQSTYSSTLVEEADVVFPALAWQEQRGHYLNLEGRLQFAEQIVTPPESIRSNHDVLILLAEKLGLDTQIDWKAALVEQTAPVMIAA
jgi:formate dehydrogenase major subunit